MRYGTSGTELSAMVGQDIERPLLADTDRDASQQRFTADFSDFLRIYPHFLSQKIGIPWHLIPMTNFWRGAYVVTETWWPVVFSTLFAIDIANYCLYPADRFGASAATVIFGFSGNYAPQYGGLLSNLGGDLVPRATYWPVVAIYGASVASGVLHAYFARHHTRAQNPVEQSIMAHYVRQNIDFTHLITEDLLPLRLYFELEDRLLRILFGENPAQDHSEIYLQITQLNTKRCMTTRLLALAALTEIAVQHPTLSENGRKVSEQLDTAANDKTFAYFYANYKQWSIGQSKKPLVHLLCALFVVPIQLLAKFHLWRLFFTKLMSAIQYEISKNACQAEWRYVPEIGNYDCTRCDSPLVDYENSLSTQGCVDRILHYPQSQKLLHRALQKFSGDQELIRLDLSRQNFTAWSQTEWQNFLKITLDSLALETLQFLNMSRAFSSVLPLSFEKMQSLADLLQHRAIPQVDLSLQQIDDAGFSALLPALNHTALTKIWLRDNRLTDASISGLQILLNYTQLLVLDLRNNQFTDFGVQILMPFIANSLVQELYLGNNLLEAPSLSIISTFLNQTQLQRLDLTKADFSSADFDEFGQALVTSTTLQTLQLAQTQLGDSGVAALAAYILQSTLHYLDWSGNEISSAGIANFPSWPVDSALQVLRLSQNTLDDDALQSLRIWLGNSTLAELYLDNNMFTTVGFQQFLSVIANTRLRLLDFSNNLLTEEAILYLSSILATGKNLVDTLYLNNVGLSVLGGHYLFENLTQTSLRRLFLADNELQSAAGEPLRQALLQAHLEVLDISRNVIAASDLELALSALPYSLLQEIYLNGNTLGKKSLSNLPGDLIKPLPQSHQQGLLENIFQVDLARAAHRATAKSPLTHFEAMHTGLSAEVARGFCRILNSTKLTVDMLRLGGNSLTLDEVGVAGCIDLETMMTSSASALSPLWVFSLPMTAIKSLIGTPAAQRLLLAASSAEVENFSSQNIATSELFCSLVKFFLLSIALLTVGYGCARVMRNISFRSSLFPERKAEAPVHSFSTNYNLIS